MSQYFKNKKEYCMHDAIDAFLKKYHLKDAYTHMQIATIWNKTVGKIIALYTKKVELSNNILTVYITSPIVKNELRISKSKLIVRLNEKIGKELIKEIIIR
jgi:predicted nucleic acid-binding Zn ribbon protein